MSKLTKLIEENIARSRKIESRIMQRIKEENYTEEDSLTVELSHQLELRIYYLEKCILLLCEKLEEAFLGPETDQVIKFPPKSTEKAKVKLHFKGKKIPILSLEDQ